MTAILDIGIVDSEVGWEVRRLRSISRRLPRTLSSTHAVEFELSLWLLVFGAIILGLSLDKLLPLAYIRIHGTTTKVIALSPTAEDTLSNQANHVENHTRRNITAPVIVNCKENPAKGRDTEGSKQGIGKRESRGGCVKRIVSWERCWVPSRFNHRIYV